MFSNYREIFDKNVDILNKKWDATSPIRARINKSNKEIANTIKIIGGIDEGINYPGKKEYENYFGSLLKKIKNNVPKEECENTDVNEQVDEIIKKFKDTAKNIILEKEDSD